MHADLPLGPRLVKAAWLSVLVGLVMQGLALMATLSAGAEPTLAATLAGALGKVSWGTVVCLGVAAGLSVPRASARSSALWGLLSAPLGFHVARAIQRALGFALGQPPSTQAAGLLIGGSLVKAAQYAVLASALWWLKRQPSATARAFFAVGLGHGLTFGIAFVALNALLTGQTGAAQLAPMAVNEVIFPALCALVIYATSRAERLVRSAGGS